MAPGGPYYAPRAVRSAALEVLDALFPMGRRSRRMVRLVFRVLHPAEFLGGIFFLILLPVRLWGWASGKVLRLIGSVIMWWLRLLGLASRAAPAAAAARRGRGRHQHVQ
jgi:phosphoglycerol transferase MdoB-like AlkP superfamily enzyme